MLRRHSNAAPCDPGALLRPAQDPATHPPNSNPISRETMGGERQGHRPASRTKSASNPSAVYSTTPSPDHSGNSLAGFPPRRPGSPGSFLLMLQAARRVSEHRLRCGSRLYRHHSTAPADFKKHSPSQMPYTGARFPYKTIARHAPLSLHHRLPRSSSVASRRRSVHSMPPKSVGVADDPYLHEAMRNVNPFRIDRCILYQTASLSMRSGRKPDQCCSPATTTGAERYPRPVT
jgi:hypothetical protein